MSLSNLIANVFHRPVPVTDPSTALKQLSSTLVSQWTQKSLQYNDWWSLVDGTWLREKTEEGVIKYPLAMNVYQWVAKKHGISVWGEFTDDASSLAQFSFRNEEGRSDDACKTAARLINRVMADSYAAAIQLENTIIMQVLGGCVFKAAWQPYNKRLAYGVRLLKTVPDYFLPVWSAESPEDMSETYTFYYISAEEAKARYCVDVGKQTYVVYAEHWTPDEYEITIDGKTPKMEGFIPKGRNPFGVIPYVYVPHLFRIDGHYGISHMDGLAGMVPELNHRMADRGDGVKETNEGIPAVRNVSGGIKVGQVGGMQYYNLGSGNKAMNGGEPDMFYPEPPALKGAAISKEFTEELWQFICHESDTPPIAWGAGNEKSQRSGMSLEMLWKPYVWHARMERIHLRAGMNQLAKIVLAILKAKTDKVSDEMLALEPRVKFGRITERERLELVQEMTMRKPVGLVSTPEAVRRLDESEGVDVEEELEQIEDEAQQLADQQMAQLEAQAAIKAKAAAKNPDKKQANPRQEK